MFSEMMRMRPACARKPEAAMLMDLMKSRSMMPNPEDVMVLKTF
jgi:hypothetical protein